MLGCSITLERGITNTYQGADIDSQDLKGLIPRITEQIFQSIVESDSHLEYVVKVSYMEIYLERIRDLLARMYIILGQWRIRIMRVGFSAKRQPPSTRGEVKGCLRQEFDRLLC